MSAARVRRAGPADAPALMALIRAHARFEGSRATITPARLAALLGRARPPIRLLVAVESGVAIGYAAVTADIGIWHGRRFAHLDALYVADRARGRGTGALLLAAARALAGRMGADRMEWQTPDWNVRAAAFYRRAGAQALPKLRFVLPLTQGGQGGGINVRSPRPPGGVR